MCLVDIMLSERGHDFAGDALAVGIDLPMAWAPALEESVEVCPCDGEEYTPFGFDSGGVDV